MQKKCNSSSVYQRGFSYIEVLIVMIIIGIIAMVAQPNLSSNKLRKLNLAAEEVMQAIRFARLESIRTRTPYGVAFNSNNNTVQVYRLLSGTITYNVHHPVDKKNYTLNLATDAMTKGVELLSYSISYQGVIGNKPYLGFNEYGNPKYYQFNTDHMLSSSAIVILNYADQTQEIHISPMVGRVTLAETETETENEAVAATAENIKTTTVTSKKTKK